MYSTAEYALPQVTYGSLPHVDLQHGHQCLSICPVLRAGWLTKPLWRYQSTQEAFFFTEGGVGVRVTTGATLSQRKTQD